MKIWPTIVLVTVIPFGTFASIPNVGSNLEKSQITKNTYSILEGGSELARCTGTKCAGPGDRIRNEEGIQGTQRVSDNRGGQATSGEKKGRRDHREQVPVPLVAGNRGGQASAGTKKGRRKHHEQGAMPLVAGNRGGRASAGTKKGPRNSNAETLAPERLS